MKKESKNQGRWFYTCQNQEPQRCGFFLWDEDAKLREEGAVLNNSRSEPKSRQVPVAQDGWDAGRSRGGMFAGVDPMAKANDGGLQEENDESTDDDSPPPAYPSQRRNISGAKRKADAANLDGDHESEDDELLPWPLTGKEEQDLIDATDAVVPAPETPRKAVKTGVYATPATTVEKKRTLPWLRDKLDEPGVLKAPSVFASHENDYLDSPSKQSTKALPPIPEQPYPPTPTLQANTPGTRSKSPSNLGRFKDALASPPDGTSSLTREVLAALSDTQVPDDVLTTLRGILSKRDLQFQGVVKGRDISRLALKAKEAKIVELQARVASLEAERELDRGVIRSLRWEGEHGVPGAVHVGEE